MDQNQFLQLLAAAVQHGASDIHLASGSSPALRIKGELMNVKSPALSDSDLEMMVRTMISDPTSVGNIAALQDYDGSFEIKNLCRFRFNIFSHRARKGVLITTSQFSSHARDYVDRIEKKIILVDGEQLAQLMIEHNVGVTAVNQYIIKKMDLDYFGDEG